MNREKAAVSTRTVAPRQAVGAFSVYRQLSPPRRDCFHFSYLT